MKNRAISSEDMYRRGCVRSLLGDNGGGIDGDSRKVILFMDGLDEQLRLLVEEACKHPPRSRQRRQGLNEIIRLIQKSGKLWRENTPYYQDAEQLTWLYFSRNICEADTGDKYDPNRSSVTTWLNGYLKRRLQDCRTEAAEEKATRVSGEIPGWDEAIEPVETLEAPPDVPQMLEEVRAWAETDPDGELRRTHIKKRPEVTAQVLILRRLPPETSWKELSAEFGLGVSTLNMFYERQCRPRLRKFGEEQGYL